MQNTITACERAGRRDGLAAGLALALAGLDAGAAPGGVAALPATAVPAGAAVIRHEMALAEGIGFVRPATRADVPAEELTALAARLGAVRIGATLRLLEQVAAHLARRLFGGEPVLAKQLVQGTLADALVATETARCGLATGQPRRDRRRARPADADRLAARPDARGQRLRRPEPGVRRLRVPPGRELLGPPRGSRMTARSDLTPAMLELRDLSRALADDLRGEALALDAEPFDADRLAEMRGPRPAASDEPAPRLPRRGRAGVRRGVHRQRAGPRGRQHRAGPPATPPC